jgi:hypothetical protein
MAALNAKSKLLDVQTPQPRITIPSVQPNESHADTHADCPDATPS